MDQSLFSMLVVAVAFIGAIGYEIYKSYKMPKVKE